MCLILFERVCGMMIWTFICDFEDLHIFCWWWRLCLLWCRLSWRWICLNFEEVVVYSMSTCIVGDLYTIVVVVKVCMLIVCNCKSYMIEKFCIVCHNNKDNYCEHADLNGDGDVDGDADCLGDGYVWTLKKLLFILWVFASLVIFIQLLW